MIFTNLKLFIMNGDKMKRWLNVRTLGLAAVSVMVLSGFYLYSKSRSSPTTILVPVNRVGLSHLHSSDEQHNIIKPIHDNHDSINVGPLPNLPGNNPETDSHRHDDSDQEGMEGMDEAREEEDNLEMPFPDQGDSKELLFQLQEDKMIGQVNYDVWWGIVGYYVDDLRIVKSYPNQPNERKTLDKLHTDFRGKDINNDEGRYGHKIYGYLIPPKTGKYQFQIKMTELTAAASVELWLSFNTNPLDASKILVLDYDDLHRPVNRAITEKQAQTTLNYRLSGPVYFEYLMKAYEGIAVVDVLWKLPDSESFVSIPSTNLAMAIKLESSGELVKGAVTKILKGPLTSNRLQTHHHAYYVGNIIYPITDLDVLPQCEFDAEYAHARRVKAYSGVYQVKESKVYPKDDTWFKNWHAKDKGNAVIEEQTAQTVVSLYKKAFNKSKTHTGQVSQLINLEQTKNGEQGSRFLLELMIELRNPTRLINTSEYVYLPKGSDKLCHTSNFQWRKGVDVHLVVSVKNLGFWIQHLMQNMEEIYQSTRDDHFYLIVVDYGSEDVNVEELMGRSSFKNWHVIHQDGKFSRSAGLQAGIDYVTDMDSIVMTIDMHLTLPTGFIEAIRRHTVKGKMGYTPFFFRLNKGYTEVNFNGFWETLTYGLFGLYKSDWRMFGGFNLRKYKDKWGGEDWDILDRSMARGYEVFRIRVPGLVHYQHTKAGMWGGKAHD